MSERKILKAVTNRYLDSNDFNGLRMDELLGPRMSPKKVVSLVRGLVGQGLLRTLRQEDDSNPFILRHGCVSVEEQLAALDADRPIAACLYPTKQHLAKAVDPRRYEGRPFTLELALGGPQMAYRNFEPQVLEPYVADPRYTFENDDVGGRIGLQSKAEVPDRDNVFLQTFGFSFTQGSPDSKAATSLTRAVAVYLRYLSYLTPEHQTMWKTRQVVGEFGLHPDYHRSSIQGEWYQRFPIHTALMIEMKTVNEMADAMGRPRFFRETERPRDLFFLLRPTRKKYLDYVSLLDRLLSDNINVDFFKGEVESHFVTKHKGVQTKQPKGTITMLDEWIRGKVTQADDGIKEMIDDLRRIRKERQPAAHGLHDDDYDPSFFEAQRLRSQDAYVAVRLLRTMLAGHIAVRAAGIEAPKELNEGMLWFA